MQVSVKTIDCVAYATIFQSTDPNSSESLDFKDCPDLADYLFN